MPREKSAGAIIFRRDDGNIYYLLLNYMPTEKGKRGQWGFAKGHVETGETEEETAKREIFEETGLRELKFIPGFKKLEKYIFKKTPLKLAWGCLIPPLNFLLKYVKLFIYEPR